MSGSTMGLPEKDDDSKISRLEEYETWLLNKEEEAIKILKEIKSENNDIERQENELEQQRKENIKKEEDIRRFLKSIRKRRKKVSNKLSTKNIPADIDIEIVINAEKREVNIDDKLYVHKETREDP